MKERGVIMREWEVQAIQDGRKTVFRRPVKPGISDNAYIVEFHKSDYPVEELRNKVSWFVSEAGDLWPCNREDAFKCPFGQIGDRIYVRETWLQKGEWHGDHWDGWEKHAISYLADGWPKQKAGETKYRKRPSIHMPKKYARIWLEITNIRVERVQDITADQVIKEGVDIKSEYPFDYYDEFIRIWNSIYKNWDENPWVWVIEFKRIER